MVNVNANVNLHGEPIQYDHIATLLQALAAKDGYVLAGDIIMSRDRSGLARFTADIVKERAHAPA